jgi:gamma-glutamylcysteine synthetase
MDRTRTKQDIGSTDPICRHFLTGFGRALASRKGGERRIGAELKFPLVNADGSAASFETACALWQHLIDRGWEPVKDAMSNKLIGAKRLGEQNYTVASCETGFCKSEFSLAHVADLFQLEQAICELGQELRPFLQRHDVHLLGYGVQPVTPPSKRLLVKKSRTSVWDKVFTSNQHIPAEDGDDMHLLTINAASHVHVSVSTEEAIPAVNVLNGFVGAQIALTAHSNIWRGRIDPRYKCVAEKFWDWWMPEANRVGVPEQPFADLADYVRSISAFRPVFVKRDGRPIVLSRYGTFEEYYSTREAVGVDLNGSETRVTPESADIDVHSTCYWHSARLSHYYTVENRANDQQPPHDLLSIPALTLGLVSALPQASRVVASYDWDALRASRESACASALEGRAHGLRLLDLARTMLDLARLGLSSRGLGEESFLAPLEQRLSRRMSPADEAAQLFHEGGIEALVTARSLWRNGDRRGQ